jgi:hypothetical protein
MGGAPSTNRLPEDRQAGEQTRAGSLQGRRPRPIALPDRLGPAASATDRRPGLRAPVLTDRGPVPAPASAAVDRCPDSGRARLSYRRAEALFWEAWAGGRCISCAIRPSPTPPRTAPTCRCCWPAPATPRCAPWSAMPGPGPEAVARHLAQTDPARRRPYPSDDLVIGPTCQLGTAWTRASTPRHANLRPGPQSTARAYSMIRSARCRPNSSA